MFDQLPSEIILKIGQYLPYDDYLNLLDAYPDVKDNLYDSEIGPNYWIQKKLSEYKFIEELGGLKRFNELLLGSNSIVSGSSLLQGLLNVRWEGSDIDIFTLSSPDYNPLEEALKNCSKVRQLGGYSTNHGYPGSVFGEKIYRIEEYGYVEDGLDQYTIMGNQDVERIQIIYVNQDNYSDLCEFVDETFDFDFCKIVYDGQKTTILDWESVRTRTCDGNEKKQNVSNMKRMLKYLKRGFQIYNIEDPDNRHIKIQLYVDLDEEFNNIIIVDWGQQANPGLIQTSIYVCEHI